MQSELHSSSTNGRYQLRVFPWEPRMSLWVETPELFDAVSQKPILQFSNASWSLDSAVWLNETVTMHLRHYPGASPKQSFVVVIDCAHQTAWIENVPVESLLAVEPMLEQLLTAAKRTII
jgi:hypothetical protein